MKKTKAGQVKNSNSHAEFISASSRYNNNQTLKQVQGDGKGFTLIELLVVVLIIGILAAVALPQYNKATLKSQLYALVPIVHSLRMAQENYYLEHGYYADSLSDLDVTPPSMPEVAFSVLKNGTDLLAVQAIYRNRNGGYGWGYREVLLHANPSTLAGFHFTAETGYCIDYEGFNSGYNQCSRLGFPIIIINWHQTWHEMSPVN